MVDTQWDVDHLSTAARFRNHPPYPQAPAMASAAPVWARSLPAVPNVPAAGRLRSPGPGANKSFSWGLSVDLMWFSCEFIQVDLDFIGILDGF